MYHVCNIGNELSKARGKNEVMMYVNYSCLLHRIVDDFAFEGRYGNYLLPILTQGKMVKMAKERLPRRRKDKARKG